MYDMTDETEIESVELTDEQELDLLILSQEKDDNSDNHSCGPKVVTILHDKDCATFNDRTAENITLHRQAARDWWNNDCSAGSWDNVSIGGWF